MVDGVGGRWGGYQESRKQLSLGTRKLPEGRARRAEEKTEPEGSQCSC